MKNLAFFITILSTLGMTGCKAKLFMRDVPEEIDLTVPLVSIVTPISGSSINASTANPFTVSGTCSESGRVVSVAASSGGVVLATPTCNSGFWTTTINFSTLVDGVVLITADHQSEAGISAITASRSLVKDRVAPTVTSVSTTTASGVYTTGATVNVTVNFSESITAAAGATVALNTTPSRSATCAAASGTSMVCSYTVAGGDVSARLNYLAVNSLSGTIKDAVGNSAVLSLPALMTANDALYTQNVVIDTSAPVAASALSWTTASPSAVTSVTSTWTKSTSPDLASQSIQYYSDAVCGTASGSAITLTSAVNTNAFTGVSGTTYSYKVTSIDFAGNSTVSACSTSMLIDTTPPTITSVTTTTSGGTYSTGATINVTLNFSESVTITGSPSIVLNTTPARSATCASGSGTSMSCTYTVVAADADARVDYSATNSLSGGTIKDAAGNSANLTLPATGSNGLYSANIIVDTSALTVTVNQLGVQADPTKALPITYAVVFNKAINPATFTTADISQGGTAGSVTWNLTNSGDNINYTLTATAVAGNGTVIPSIAANTVQDSGGNNNTASTSSDSVVTYDTVAPTITSVTSTTTTGTYGAGSAINVTVNFSESVTVSSSPTITLNTTPARSATCANGTGTSMSCTYTVQAGDTDARIDYTATTALSGGTIQDAATNSANLALPALASSGLYSSNIKVDTTAPTITSVTTTNTTGSYGVGATINVTVNFSESVTVSGSPTITLNTTPARSATCTNGTGTSMSCAYTVVAGDNDAQVDYTATTALSGGTIQDVAGNNATLTLPALTTSGLYTTNVKVDTTAPTITSVTTTNSSGTYSTGAVINVTVGFSESVTVTGSPTITLNTTPARSATCTNGTGTTMSCSYTVQAGDADSQVDYTSTTALSGGTIQDGVGNIADLTLPAVATSGLYTTNVKVDTGALTIFVDQAGGQADPTNSLPITFDVTFNKAINAASFDTTDITQSGTATVTTWTITDSGDHINFLLKATVMGSSGTVVPSIAANRVQDLAGNNNTASTTLGDNSVTYDTTAPTVTSVTSTTTTGTYSTGANINVTVTFSESVTVTGSPTITLNTTPARSATCANGTGTSMSCTYTVQAGDSDARIDYTATTALSGGTIKDAAGNNATLTLPALASSGLYTTNIKVDTAAPTITSVTTTNSSGSYGLGANINVTVNFSESVTVTGSPTITLNTTPARSATCANGTGTSMSCTYTVQAGDNDSRLDYTSTSALSGGTIVDVASNAATLTLPALTTSGLYTTNVKIDTTAPTITSVTTTTSGGTYSTGSVINVTVNFSESVTVSGSPTITLNTTPARSGTCANGTGTSMSCSYTVVAGDTDSRVDYTSTTALSGGTLVDAAGNSATLTLPALTTSGLYTTNIIIDATGLSLTVNQIGPQADPTKSLPITYAVVFNKAINPATFTTADITQSGTATGVTWGLSDSGDHINFTLTATAVGTNGTVVPTIAANTVQDAGGNNNTASTSTDNSVIYDTTAPTITSVTSTTSTGTYGAGSNINITVNFSESVTVSGSPTITLNTSPARSATCANGTGTSMSCTYTVQSGDSATRLDYTATTALSGGTIEDAATNGATLTLPAITTSGLYTTNIKIDSVAPTITSVTTTTASGSYTTGANINVTVNFSESVTVTGSPTITLNTTPARSATCANGTGTSMSCTYTVVAGDADTQIDYTSTSALSGGTIQDSVGNNATLTLPALTTSGLYTTNIKIDTVPVSLTVNQIGPQADPTKALPITYAVVFNKAINAATFTTADITQNGTATGVTWGLSDSGDHTNFTLTATAVGTNGTVIPSVAANLVQDSAGNNNTASTSTDNSVTYDNVAPTVLSVTTTKTTGSYSTGTSIDIKVTFSETITLTGTASITLNTTPQRSATCSSTSGADLICAYVVQANDADLRLDYLSTSALSGTIRDAATNDATLTLPALTTSGLYTANIKINTLPSAINITLKTPTTTYGTVSQPTFTVSSFALPTVVANVNVYSDSTCSTLKGTVAATTGNTSTDVQLSAALPNQTSVTTYYTDFTDSLGSHSTCTNGTGTAKYQYDSTAPVAVTGWAITPSGSSTDATPTLSGTGEGGATIKLFPSSVCSAAEQIGTTTISGTGDANPNAGTAFTMMTATLSPGTYTFYYKLWDVAGNALAGPCVSTGLTYTKIAVPDGTFTLAQDISVGNTPYTMAKGDFNGDGIDDLVTSNFGGTTVSVLLGVGDGTFAISGALDSTVGSSPLSIATGDFNLDGNLDIAVSRWGGTMTVALGAGDGYFHPPTDYPGLPGWDIYQIVAADLNSDGFLDLVVGTGWGGSVATFKGRGNGSFELPGYYPVGSGAVVGVAVGDVNSDGILDVVASSAGEGSAVLIGFGDTSFQPPTVFATGGWTEWIYLADLNGDGILDLTGVNGSGNNDAFVSIGNGDGTFQAFVRNSLPAGAGSIAVGDFNGDGIVDLAAALSDGSLAMLFGNGDGTYQAPVTTYMVGALSTIVQGHFDADTITDLAITDTTNNMVHIFLGNFH